MNPANLRRFRAVIHPRRLALRPRGGPVAPSDASSSELRSCEKNGIASVSSHSQEEIPMLRWNCLLGALLVLANTAAGQPEKQPFDVPAPKGWGKESISLPPSFAPEMKWKGVEELRFAPGMFKADSDSFLSYALLFWLPADQKIDPKTTEQELLAYYRGLAKVVLKSKKQDVDVGTFALTIKEAAEKTGKRPSGEPFAAFVAELKWTEPFATGKSQTLHLDIQTWKSEKHKHHCVFVCASPQPESAEVWKSLREIRTGCTFR
jgi:hypothetical protein